MSVRGATTPARPKTPGSAVMLVGPEAATPLSTAAAAGSVAAAVLFQTPRRKSTDGDSTHRCSSSSSSSSSSVRKTASGGRISVGDDGSSEGLRTPAFRGGSCAICLSPLKKSSSGPKGEVHTVQPCRHNFHRTCLVENRRAGNVGCPYCRGPLPQGLTPEATLEEREAKALAERQQEQREAIRNAAGRARMALARSLRLRQEALAREAASAGSAAPEGTGDSTLVQSY